jgi:iron complex transport system permease protein
MNKNYLSLGLMMLTVSAICLSLFVGRFSVPFGAALQILWAKITFSTSALPQTYQSVLIDIRLPRALLGALVGASLATSGAAFQSLFHNPLVSPGILGVTAGAGFGAALAIVLFSGTTFVYIFAFAFGILAVTLSYIIGKIYDTSTTITLVLGGVIISAMFSALLSMLKYVADPYNQLPTIVFWLMGSLAGARYEALFTGGLPMLTGMLGLILMRWRINVLSMGDKEAGALGVNVKLHKALVIFFATLATTGAVCVSGIIGWVGLIVPHVGRMIVGNDNRYLMPVCIFLGACFLVFVDIVARSVSSSELPLGIITALTGGPFFVYLLKKTKGRNW